MTVWVLFLWSAAVAAPIAAYTFDNKADCLDQAEPYKRAVCVEVVVPRANSR